MNELTDEEARVLCNYIGDHWEDFLEFFRSEDREGLVDTALVTPNSVYKKLCLRVGMPEAEFIEAEPYSIQARRMDLPRTSK